MIVTPGHLLYRCLSALGGSTRLAPSWDPCGIWQLCCAAAELFLSFPSLPRNWLSSATLSSRAAQSLMDRRARGLSASSVSHARCFSFRQIASFFFFYNFSEITTASPRPNPPTPTIEAGAVPQSADRQGDSPWWGRTGLAVVTRGGMQRHHVTQSITGAFRPALNIHLKTQNQTKIPRLLINHWGLP